MIEWLKIFGGLAVIVWAFHQMGASGARIVKHLRSGRCDVTGRPCSEMSCGCVSCAKSGYGR